jgi:hypothetical protein
MRFTESNSYMSAVRPPSKSNPRGNTAATSVRFVVNNKSPAQDLGIAPKVALPELIAHRGPVVFSNFFFG